MAMLNASFLWVVTRVQTSFLDFLGGELENKLQLTQSPFLMPTLAKGVGAVTDDSCM